MYWNLLLSLQNVIVEKILQILRHQITKITLSWRSGALPGWVGGSSFGINQLTVALAQIITHISTHFCVSKLTCWFKYLSSIKVNFSCWVLFRFHRFGYKCIRWNEMQLKKKLVHKNCATGYWLPHSLFNFFLKFLDQRYWRFSEGYLNNFSTELSSQIFDCCTSHWIRPVHRHH